MNNPILELNDNVDIYTLEVIGVDETGVGDYFAPLVSCAVFVPLQYLEILKEIGVKDSKKISDKKIILLAKEIKKYVNFSISHLSPSGYNSLNKNYNANELKFFTHIKALNLLSTKISFENKVVLIDQYSTLKSIQKYYQKILIDNNWAKLNQLNIPVLLTQKAESKHISVACASILAREFLINFMENQRQKYNFDFPLGASQKVKEVVKDFVQMYGKEKLGEVCKLSFKI